MRRRAPRQLRRLRRTRPPGGDQRERLRRDAARPVRVGRQAARGELRRGRARSRLRCGAAGRDRPDGGARLPRGDARVRGDAHPGPLVPAPGRGHRRRALRRHGRPRGARAVRAQPHEGGEQGPPARPREADPRRGRPGQARRRPAADRPDRGAGGRPGIRGGHPRRAARVPPDAADGSPSPARPLRVRARRPQGGRRRQRRHARLDRAHDRPRRRRSPLPPVQGGAGLGARAVPRQEPACPPRPARRRGPAADAVEQRHPARLGAARRDRRRRARLLRPPAVGPQGLAADRGDGAVHDGGLRPHLRLDARPRARPFRGRRRDRGLPRRGRRLRPGPRRRSPRRTPTRTSATTRRPRGRGRWAHRGPRHVPEAAR